MEKENYWMSLLSLKYSKYASKSIIARYLNVVLHNKEKRGGINIKDPYRERMENLITQWDVLDFKTSKGKYTWTNRRLGPHHIASRLDRFLVQTNFLI